MHTGAMDHAFNQCIPYECTSHCNVPPTFSKSETRSARNMASPMSGMGIEADWKEPCGLEARMATETKTNEGVCVCLCVCVCMCLCLCVCVMCVAVTHTLTHTHTHIHNKS